MREWFLHGSFFVPAAAGGQCARRAHADPAHPSPGWGKGGGLGVTQSRQRA
jgi:hypothetical protein